jgi:RNA polymerase sigma-70 factor, ECF subfamily
MNNPSMTEILLERIRRRDRKAQQEFYQLFSVRLFRLAYRYVVNEQDAGSIVNMGFFKIFNHIQEFVYQGDISMQAWMKRIVINEALMFLRQRISYNELDEANPGQILPESIPEDNLTAEDYYRLIRNLPDDLRTVFNLFAIDGFSHKEIATRLNIKENSSRVYLTRARKILQHEITNKQRHDGKE